MRMNWIEKVAKMPATLDDNQLPRKLLGAWCFRGKTIPGIQLKTLHKSYLDQQRKLQFDTNDKSDSAQFGSHGTFKKYTGTDLQQAC